MKNWINIKNIIFHIMIFIISLFLISCSNNNQNSTISNNNGESKNNSVSSNIGANNENINNNTNSIVIYFSRTNNTEKIANYIVELTNSDTYEILAKIPYTDDDIKYYTNCRADKEQNDDNVRVEIGSESIDLSKYNTIYLGYPIWHGKAPKIMYTFVETYDLDGKTIIPFCTSGSSPIGSSATILSNLTGKGKWMDGKRFSQSDNKSVVSDWLKAFN